MYYVIKNSKGVFIMLNENGKAVTCKESKKGVFDKVKACNILQSLPKTLKKLNFKIECIPDIAPKVIENNTYKISDDIQRWVERFGTCDDIIKEAKQRQVELEYSLDNIDKDICNTLHIIEIESSKDLYHGWLLYKDIRALRIKRRQIKDELLIISSVLKENNKQIAFERKLIQSSIDGLSKRKYTFRVVEEEEDDSV